MGFVVAVVVVVVVVVVVHTGVRYARNYFLAFNMLVRATRIVTL